MDLRYAHAFYDAATTLHFGKTAKNLSIAPSAITRQIQLFEDSIGESLFVRSSRKVILTGKGTEIYELLKPLFLKGERPLHKLRVGGLAGVIDNHFWEAISPILKRNSIRLIVHESTSTPALEKLLEGELDIAFVNEKISNDLIQYYPLGKEELVLISKSRISIKELKQVTWVYCGNGNKIRSLAGTDSDKQIKVSNISKVLDLVELGLGVGIVPLSSKLSARNFHISTLPMKNRKTFLATLKYRRGPHLISEVVKDIVTTS